MQSQETLPPQQHFSDAQEHSASQDIEIKVEDTEMDDPEHQARSSMRVTELETFGVETEEVPDRLV